MSGKQVKLDEVEELALLHNLGVKLLQISRSTPFLTTALIGHKAVRAPLVQTMKAIEDCLITAPYQALLHTQEQQWQDCLHAVFIAYPGPEGVKYCKAALLLIPGACISLHYQQSLRCQLVHRDYKSSTAQGHQKSLYKSNLRSARLYGVQAKNADANVRLIALDPLNRDQFHKVMEQIDGGGKQATV